MKRTALFSFLFSLSLLLAACGSDDPNPPGNGGNTGGGDTGGNTGGDMELSSQSYNLGPQAYLDVDGDATVTFQETADGNTEVTIDFGGAIGTDFPEHPAHIHMGEAGSGGAIVVTLTPVDDATGMSMTEVSQFDDGTPVTYSELIDYGGYVNVHLSPENIDVVFASANIGSNIDVPLPETPTIAGLVTGQANAETDAQFTVLLQALTDAKAADLTATLSDAAAGPFTVLAPTDAAFQALIDSDPNDDLNSPADVLALENLSDILSYHALPSPVVRTGVAAAATAEGGTAITTVEGSDLTLSANAEGDISINDTVAITAARLMSDMTGTNITAVKRRCSRHRHRSTSA